ncbi:hypothetical protein R3W88_024331 [Solanum pinnatisectum]|uniref:Protein TIC 214 n=1 Tax=Solanum pinnatisectum TaxID=50273 RepID=A0AAV9M0X9_9SOLN|nr:hypothetical protein R3W88_024331 [Solanum pinnatisectum]
MGYGKRRKNKGKRSLVSKWIPVKAQPHTELETRIDTSELIHEPSSQPPPKLDLGQRLGNKYNLATVEITLEEAKFMNHSVSYHSPILIKCEQHQNIHPRPFRFYTNVMENPDFVDILKKALGDRQLQTSNPDQSFIEQEKKILIEMKKWSNVEESTLRQKARAIWIEHDDSNSKYFHAQWKISTIHNTISSIYTESRLKLAEPLQIEVEFISIFKDLIGTKEK